MLKKKTTKKTYLKDISSLPDKEYSDWIAVGPRIHKPDVVIFLRSQIKNIQTGLQLDQEYTSQMSYL